MKGNHLFRLLLACCLVFVVNGVFVDDIGPPPQKVHVLTVPSARYPIKKHKPLNLAEEDLPADAFGLAKLINKYRKESGLNQLTVSPSLMFVANSHAFDLKKLREMECGLYSWSQNPGLWTSCCSDAENNCFERKVQELTSYPGVGVELVFATNYTLRAETLHLILKAWKASPPHNDVILNQGWWKNTPWKSIGAGVNSDGFATVWFGALEDTTSWVPSKPQPTNFQPIDPTQDTDATSIPNSNTESPDEDANGWKTWNPTQDSNGGRTEYPTQDWYPTQDPNGWRTWYPTQDPNGWRTWYPTQDPNGWRTEYPTQNWYPTQDPYGPRTWLPHPNKPSEHWGHFWKHNWKTMRNRVYELWLMILSVLVFLLLGMSMFMFRVIRQQRNEIKALILSSQGTSCAIPEKC